MRGIVTPPRAPASRGARGLVRRLLAGDPSLEPAPRLAPVPDQPAAAGPPEPSNPAKLAEAHAMARRPDHPLHAALMNLIHPDHRHAVATYEALFREAYAPAKPRPQPASLPGAAEKPAVEGRKRPLEGRIGGPQLAQASPSAGTEAERPQLTPVPPAKPALTPATLPIPGVKPPAPRPFLSRRVMAEGTAEDIIAFDRAAGAADQAAAQAATMNLPPPYRHGLPPKTFFVSNKSYAAMLNTILALPNLSPTERYVFMRLLSYEGTPYDSGGGSRGGISKQTWDNARAMIRHWRKEEGRDTPVTPDVEDLTIEDIFDAMRAYAIQEFGENGVAQFAKIDNRELAFQLFDLQYQYGGDLRGHIWDNAVRSTMEEFSATERDRFGELVQPTNPKASEGSKASTRVTSAAALDGRLASAFAGNLQRAKAERWIEHARSDYKGSTRARIWGITREP